MAKSRSKRKRAGRPRKEGNREPNGRVSRKERSDDLPPVEGMMRRLELAGIPAPVLCAEPDEHHEDAVVRHRREVKELAAKQSMTETSADHPVDVLYARNKLLSVDEMQSADLHLASSRLKAARVFAGLHWRFYGHPFASAADLGYRTQLEIAPKRPDGWESLSHDEREEWFAGYYRSMRSALQRKGRHVEAVTIRTVAECRMPRPAMVEVLRAGLEALREVRPPKIADRRDEQRRVA